MTVASFEAATVQRYAQAREALWGKPKQVNVIVEEKRAIEALRRAERLKWERAQQELKRREDEARRWDDHLKNIDVSSIALRGVASARFETDDPEGTRPSMLKIAIDILHQHPGVTLEDVRGDGRKSVVMLARRHVIAAIRMYRPDLSLPAIGRFVCKDHTTCHHAIRKFAESNLSIVG